jgi:hypothetical protein
MMILQQTRGALSSGDQCSLDLPFAETKSLAARIGPTPAFTRASAASFIGSDGLIQTATTNTPRFDHDSVTLASKGLLIEESRTNTMLASAQFDSALWNAAGLRTLTVTANDTVSPSGAMDADRLTVGATTTSYRVIQNTANVISGTAYTFSCFFKANQVTRAQITAGNTTTLPITANFDLTGNGSVVSNTFGTASIQNYGDGWYRCIITGTAGANSNTSLSILPVSGTLTTYPGNSLDSFWAWGAQLEAGAFATSYIPTTTTSAVRSADVCSITGSAFSGFWNRFAGTCVVGVGSALGTEPRFVSNLVAARAIELFGATNLEFFEASGSQVVRIVTGTTYPNKIGLAYSINDYQGVYNGILGGFDTNTGGTIPDATQLHIGNLGGTSNRLTGHIQSIRYFKKRLSNAKLQALTV